MQAMLALSQIIGYMQGMVAFS